MQRDKETILGHQKEKTVDNRENKPYPKSRSSIATRLERRAVYFLKQSLLAVATVISAVRTLRPDNVTRVRNNQLSNSTPTRSNVATC